MKFLLKFIDPSMQEDLLNPQGKVIRYKETYYIEEGKFIEDAITKYLENNYTFVCKYPLHVDWNT